MHDREKSDKNPIKFKCRYILLPVGDKLFLLSRVASKVIYIVLGLKLIKNYFFLEIPNKKHLSLSSLCSTMS